MWGLLLSYSQDNVRVCSLCYAAAAVFCPMVMADKDADFCLKCPFFTGLVVENGRLALGCSWEPKTRASLPVMGECAKAA
jgi:hypothetical protein